MEVIDKKVLIKEVRPGSVDRIFSVKNLPKHLIFGKEGELLPGVLYSQTGDNGIVFERYNREANDHLNTLDRYIDAVWPRSKTLPKRILNQSVIGLSSSPALTMAQLEERMLNDYGVPYLELPIVEDKDAPSFDNITEAKHVAKSYQDDSYYNRESDQGDKNEPKEEIQEVQEAVQSLTCVACKKQLKTLTALKTHITKMHKIKEAATSSG